MATPESNTMLALQLGQLAFQPIAERRALQQRLADMDREDALKKQLADDQNRRYIELEQLRATNSQALEDKRGLREDSRLLAMQTREDTRASESERRQKDNLTAKERADLLNEFDRNYPKYAQAVRAAGGTVKKREDFPETRAGLGNMEAETADALTTFQEKHLKDAADGLLKRRARLQLDLQGAEEQMLGLETPSEADQKIAREQALKAVRQIIASDVDGTYKKLSAKAKADGMNALAQANTDIARSLLGAEAISTYEAALASVLMGLPGTKAREQEFRRAQQNRLAIQREFEKTDAIISAGSATNPHLLAEEPAAVTPAGGVAPGASSGSGIQRMQRTAPATKPGTELDVLGKKRPPPGTASANAGMHGAGGEWEDPATVAPTYKYPALSVLGMAERAKANAPTGAELAMAPANLAAAPGRLIGEAARVGGAGLRGLWSGDYDLRPNPVTAIGENIGDVIAADPAAAAPGASAMQANRLRALMTPSPVAPQAPQRSVFGADNPGRQADIDRIAAIIQWLQSNGGN